MNDILPYLAGAAGIAIIVAIFIYPYTGAARRRTQARMNAIGGEIEKETLAAFTRMHENVATGRANASATTGTAEIYAAMSEIDAKNRLARQDIGESLTAVNDDESDQHRKTSSYDSGSTIDQYSAYWHDRTENPPRLNA